MANFVGKMGILSPSGYLAFLECGENIKNTSRSFDGHLDHAMPLQKLPQRIAVSVLVWAPFLAASP